MKENAVKTEMPVPACEHADGAVRDMEAAIAAMPDGAVVERMCEWFHCLADPTRMRILLLLFHGEACVCEISGALGMTLSAISHQLRLLRTAALVGARREGKSMIYFLADDHVRTVIGNAAAHAVE
jgi:ArsR family transcriptional regulator